MILAPYTVDKQHPEWRARLERHAPGPVEWVEIDPDRPTHYAQILCDAWREPGDLVIVEHDIGIHPYTIERLLACSQPWCGNPYNIAGRLLVCLGCTKFSAHLKATLPGLMIEAAAVGNEQDGGGIPAGHWCRLDVRIGAALERLGHQRHAHWPPVDHFHEYQ